MTFTMQDALDMIDRALKLVQPTIYYQTSAHCQRTNERGEIAIYQIAPNSAISHEVYLMHDDNLPAFLEKCAQNNIRPVSIQEWAQEQRAAFDQMMADNAWKYGQMLLDRLDK